MPEPLHCTVFLFLSLLVAGVGQVCWMRSAMSNRFNASIDCGYTFHNQPIFGANKTWRGFVFMVPATGMCFLLIYAAMRFVLAEQLQLWSITLAEYFLLGCWTGLGFMIIELPNSFAKRRLNIAPGEPAKSQLARGVCFIVDQIDSIAGGLLAVWVFVPVPLGSVASLMILGGLAHFLFNVVLKHLGLRTRAG